MYQCVFCELCERLFCASLNQKKYILFGNANYDFKTHNRIKDFFCLLVSVLCCVLVHACQLCLQGVTFRMQKEISYQYMHFYFVFRFQPLQNIKTC